MSFGEKVASIMAKPGQDPNAKEDVPWWLKYGGRLVGSIGGGLAIFLGVWTCVDILMADVTCFLAGVWQMLAGFIVLCCEAPCCCMFIDHVQRFSDMIDNRPHWNRAAAFVILAIPPIIMCPGIRTIFGSGLIFATGAIYGMMSLGKKASAEEMRQAAAAESAPNKTTMRSNLVANAQPISFTGTPFDSNV